MKKSRRHLIADKAPWIIAILAILLGMFGIVFLTRPVNSLIGKMSLSSVVIIYDVLSILIALIFLALYTL